MTAPDGALPPIGDTNVGSRPSPAVQEAATKTRGLRAFPGGGYARFGRMAATCSSPLRFTARATSTPTTSPIASMRTVACWSATPATPATTMRAPRGNTASRRPLTAASGSTHIRGSRIRAAGRAAEWWRAARSATHAILAQNPRIAADDRVARRLFIYRPGRTGGDRRGRCAGGRGGGALCPTRPGVERDGADERAVRSVRGGGTRSRCSPAGGRRGRAGLGLGGQGADEPSDGGPVLPPDRGSRRARPWFSRAMAAACSAMLSLGRAERSRGAWAEGARGRRSRGDDHRTRTAHSRCDCGRCADASGG